MISRSKNVPTEWVVTAFALGLALLVGVLSQQSYALAVVLPVALAGGALLLVRPVLGAFLLAGTIPLEASLMLEGVTVSKLIGITVVGTWGAQKLFRREPLKPLVSPALVQVAVLFLSLACLSLLWAEYPQGLTRRLFLLTQLIVLFILLSDLISSWDRMVWVARFLVLAASVAAVLVILEYFGGDVRRAGGGVAGGINKTASMLVAVLPFAFFLFRSRDAGFWRWLGLAYIPLSGLSVAATLSRMNYLLFPLVIAVHLALMTQTGSGRRRIVGLGLAMVMGVAFLPMDAVRERAMTMVPYLASTVDQEDPVGGASARGFHLRVSLAMFADHPILGVGYNNYQPQFLSYQARFASGSTTFYTNPQDPHNSNLSLLATLGIGGGLLWGGLFAVAASYLITSWRRSEDSGGTPLLMTQAISIALGIQFLNGFYEQIHQVKLFWVVIGLSLAVHRIRSAEAARSTARGAAARPEPRESRAPAVARVPGAVRA